MKVVGFQIKLPLTRETVDSQKQLDKMGKGLEGLDKKTIPALSKTTKEYLKGTREGLRETTSAVERFGRAFSESIERSLTRVSKFNETLHKSRERIFGIKEAFEATAIGAATFFAGEKLLEEGRQELRTRQRIRREFGREAGGINEIAERTGRGAGIQGDEAARMLIPLAETLRDTVQAGATFRGLRGPLTATQAEALRKKNLEVGATLMQRMAVLAPELSAGEIGQVMNDALTGPEGIRSMISAFNLSKRSRTLSEENEKGMAFKALSPEERKRLGVTKAGQFVQQADLVQLMLERSGFTAGAMKEETQTLDFQWKAIGNTFKDVFGEIGSSMLSKLDGGLSKGGTLAERLNQYLEKNKPTIQHIGEELGSAAQHVGELAGYLPRIGSFLSEHKTSLLALGAAFVGFKGMSYIGGKLEGAAKGEGLLGGLVGGAGRPIPVYVTNLGGGLGGAGGTGLGETAGKLGKFQAALGTASAALAAFGVGYSAGSFLDKKYKISDSFEKTAHILTANKDALTLPEQVVKTHWWDIVKASATGNFGDANKKLAQDLANRIAHPEVIQIHPQPVILDGKKVAEVITPHIVRDVRNKTADGAARTWSE